jgi:tetratricopeptide (TPR) repeat protein
MDLGPALFVCAMRPHEDAPGWQVRESALQAFPGRLTEIVLAPLSRRDSDELVKGLLRLPELPNELRRMIRRKAEGNPFFTEEIIRTLIDNGDLMQEKAGGRWVTTRQIDEIAIPDNVQALLAARMDRLQPATRRSLQAASVIGRTFSHQLLERVVSLPEGSLEQQVQEFQNAGLILGESHTSQRTYTFRHDLTRDAVYQSLLHRQRRELHRLVAEAIEQLGADRLSEEATRLAFHFEQAGQDDKARHFHVIAGQEAARLYAQSEAITHFQRALELAHGSAAVTGDQLTDVYLSLGRSLEMASRFKEALDLYHGMEAKARAQGDEGMALKALIHQGRVHSTPNVEFDFQKGEALAHEALALAERLNKPEAQARVYASMINLYRLSNRWSDGRKAGERAIALARELDEPELLAFCLNDLAHIYMSSVDPRQAHVLLEEASGLWQQLGNQPMLADTYATMALTDYILADFEEVLAHSAAAYQISQVIDNPWGQSYSLLMIGDVYWERGLVGRAIASMEESIALAERAGFLVPQVENRAFLGLIYGYLGDFERGLALARQAVELGERSGAPYLKPASGFLAELYVVQGDLQAAEELLGPIGELVLADPVISTFAYSAQSRLQLALGNYQEALALADNLLSTLKPMGVRVFLPKILFHRGEALIALGRLDAARDSLDRARQEAEVMGAQAILWLIMGTQAALEDQAGNDEKAETLRMQAREIIHFIADQIPEPALRASFLGMDNVRPLLGSG